MQKEDYLLRNIALMARALARIRQRLLEGKNAEAGDDLTQAAHEGGIDLPFLIALDESSLRPLLLVGGDIDRPKCAFFAELMYLEWRRQLAIGHMKQAERCAQRGLLFYALAYDSVVMDGATREHVAALEAYLEGDEVHEG